MTKIRTVHVKWVSLLYVSYTSNLKEKKGSKTNYCGKTNKSWRRKGKTVLSEKSQTRKHISPCDSIYINFKKQAKLRCTFRRQTVVHHPGRWWLGRGTRNTGYLHVCWLCENPLSLHLSLCTFLYVILQLQKAHLKISLFIWNTNLTGYPAFYLKKKSLL